MFTLRIIEQKGQTSNQSLGNFYTVTYKASCKDYEKAASKTITNEKTYAIVVGDFGKVVFPLFDNREYFIMTESGKTFERL